MAMNTGVKALLSWVNSLKLVDREVNIDDLQNWSILLQIVEKINKSPNSDRCLSVEERFQLVSEFVESLGADRAIYDEIDTAALSSVSTSPRSDDSPVFTCTRKITFVELHTVASSSTSKSPLQDIMNTPKFQLQKMKREMVKERDLRDSLERELNGSIALVEQRESFINRLQYRLDKLKEEQDHREKLTREQIEEMETKNNTLQMRLHDVLKENKDLKSYSSLMERKVDQLTEENGSLSFQMRSVCSQLASFEAEVGRLKAAHESAQGEWETQWNRLQNERQEATNQKEILTEQIEILQGKISCLEDDLCRASREEVGENMRIVTEEQQSAGDGSNTPARMTGPASDQLIGLPGYRRSTRHSKLTSTFCVGEENEPETGPEDWMRIAELQARNKACLPHLKSSYALEFETRRPSAFVFTDDEIRTGDPSETICRASMMPRPPKRSAATLPFSNSSPEKRVKASCFPRPLTPKNKNVRGVGKDAAMTPADRRMMFTIENSPKMNTLLKRGLKKLRNSRTAR